MNVNKNVPVMFQKLNSYEVNDTRFLNVKIWLMHLGENLNSSFFDKISVEEAIPSLSNTPILVYVEDNNDGEADFSDHRQVLVREDGQIKIKYLCQAIGVIPETNNAQFEFRVCDDGVSREFLTVTGLIWQKWDDPIDIFNRDIIKSQSMEIHDGYEGHFGDDKLYHFTKFQFFGACGLGNTVIPAMQNATIEAQFSYENLHSEIQNKMEQFKLFSQEQYLPNLDSNQAKDSQEGGNKIVPENILALLQKYSLTEENLAEKEIVYSEFSIEDLEVKIQEIFQSEIADEIVENPTPTDFSLTSSQLEDELRRELAEIETIVEDYYGEIYSYPRYYYSDSKPDQNIVVAWDGKNSFLVGFSFTILGDNVEVDASTGVRYKVDLNPMDLSGDTDDDEIDMFSVFTSKAKSEFMLFAKEKSLTKQFEIEKETAVLEVTTKFSELQVKFDELQSKYALTDSELASKLQTERESSEETIFSSFANSLTEDEMAEIKSKKSEFSLQEIDDKLCVILGRKNKIAQAANFSKTPEVTKPLGFQIPQEEKKTTGKSYDDLFEKFNKKNEE